jgi:hypothetical protein
MTIAVCAIAAGANNILLAAMNGKIFAPEL